MKNVVSPHFPSPLEQIGDLLHGVIPGRDSGETRVTFLVIWHGLVQILAQAVRIMIILLDRIWYSWSLSKLGQLLEWKARRTELVWTRLIICCRVPGKLECKLWFRSYRSITTLSMPSCFSQLLNYTAARAFGVSELSEADKSSLEGNVFWHTQLGTGDHGDPQALVIWPVKNPKVTPTSV